MTPHPAAPAGMTCPACGVGSPAAARFCPACGQRLLGGVEERRVVTVLFAEFGFPTGHDDDAARAVRAALAMRDIVKTAEPDQSLLSARTLRAAREVAEVGPPSLLEVRGQRQPVEVVEVLGLSPAEPATDPMVGRETDLPRLVGALDHAAHHNRLALAAGDTEGAAALLERSLAALEATGHRLGQLQSLAVALRRAGRDEEAEAAAKRAGDQAAAIGAHALARRLGGAGAAGPAGSRTGGGMGG